MGIVYYQGIINKNKEEIEVSRKGRELESLPSDKNLVEDREQNVVVANGNINTTTVKDLRNIDYSTGETYQFRDIRKGENVVFATVSKRKKRAIIKIFGEVGN